MPHLPLRRPAAAGLALTLLLAALLGPARGDEAKPAAKDSSARSRPKEITLTASVAPESVKAGGSVTYTVTATLEPGWHIYKYAKQPDPNGPRNTTFDLFDPAGLKPKGDWAASKPPIKKPEPAFNNMVLEFYEDDVAWSITLDVPPGTGPGKKLIRSQIGFQICDAHSCKFPVRWTVPDVTLTVLPGVAATVPDSNVKTAASTSELPKDVFQSGSASTPAPEKTATADAAPVSEVAQRAEQGLLPFLLFSAGGGLLALVMPCVWPMVPITVNFFVKQGHHNKGKTTGLAVTYCLAIIGIFTTLGVLVSFFFSATALQDLANNPWLNAAVALLFVAFGLSLLGLFEIRLPNALLNVSSRGESKGGLVGVIFMALTLTITSFTCTFPVVGGLIVMAAGGQFFYPIIGLATFSAVVAFPFFLLALAPGLIAKMPKSGDWMNAVKVVGGLVELGAAFKFMNTAEIGFGAVPDEAWFDAPLVLSIWVALAVVCGLYLLGIFRTDHDHDEVKVGPGRLLGGALFLGIGLFLAPALFGHPPRSPIWDLVVGILPPDFPEMIASAQGAGTAPEGAVKADSPDPVAAQRQEKTFHGVAWGMSYEQALDRAKAEGKPILIDFTGVNCANCRTMEQSVIPRKEVVALLKNFITIQLYTDYVPIGSITQAQREDLAEKNQELQLDLTSDGSNPFYVALGPDGKLLGALGGYRRPPVFVEFLNGALKKLGEPGKLAQVEAKP